MSGARRGFFRDALSGLRKVLDEVAIDAADAPPTPTFVPPPHPAPTRPVPEDKPRLGKAKVAARLCLNHGGAFEDESPCENCVVWCPEPGAIALGDDLIPRVVTAACTGCGACAEHCKAYPSAITIV